MARYLNLLIVLSLLLAAVCGGCTAQKHLSPTAIQRSPVASAETPAKPSAPLPSATPQSETPAGTRELPFGQFLEQSFDTLLRRDPETISFEGLDRQLGTKGNQLTPLTEDYIRETYALQRDTLARLHTYDRAALSPEEQITYDAYEWYLDDLVQGQEFIYQDYPVNQMTILSVPSVTEYLFTDIQTVSDLASAQVYLERLAQVGDKFAGLIDGLQRRQQAGILPPRMILEWALPGIQSMGARPARNTPYYTALQQKLAPLSSIPPAEQQALLGQAEKEIKNSILPAYQELAQVLQAQMTRAPRNTGVWQHPQGEAYYRYALRHHTTTELTPEQVHQMGLDELKRIQGEMHARFAALGYPIHDNLGQLYQRLAEEGEMVAGAQVMERYRQLIEGAGRRSETIFDLRPSSAVEVRSIPQGSAYYISPALDGSRPGIFYAPVGGEQPYYRMPSLAYHEAVPGHHFQIGIARDLKLPLFRSLAQFNAYTEGWALYAERLVAEQGWYADDPAGDLGRLQYEALRAARLVTDTGIHAKKWEFEQAVDFMVENTGMPRQAMEYEVARYIAWPGQATSYAVGMLRLLELRRQAQEALGKRFDLKEFHNTVLGSGSLPLEALQGMIDRYITLASLEKVNAAGSDIPFYTMQYRGDYGFQKYLQGKLEGTERKPVPSSLLDSFACSVFTARTPQGERLLGRNFDWYRHPALLLFTDPPDGYASASMVDIAYLGFEGEIPAGASLEPLLQAPYLPFDGMNERGLAVGMMAVPHGEGGNDPGKPTLDDLELIRLLLDNAANLDEALELVQQYNVDWGGGPPIHYLIADASGSSAVVEWIDGKAQVLRNENPWQVSTNFLFAETPAEQRRTACWRYAAAGDALSQADGVLSGDAAMALLKQISQSGSFPTIWSVLYNLGSGKVQVVVNREYGQVHSFQLER